VEIVAMIARRDRIDEVSNDPIAETVEDEVLF